jgi:hypothetical protein
MVNYVTPDPVGCHLTPVRQTLTLQAMEEPFGDGIVEAIA